MLSALLNLTKPDTKMNFKNVKTLLQQKFVYIKLGMSDYMICGDLQIVQKGFALFVCWTVGEHAKPILQTVKRISGGEIQISYESHDIPRDMSCDSTRGGLSETKDYCLNNLSRGKSHDGLDETINHCLTNHSCDKPRDGLNETKDYCLTNPLHDESRDIPRGMSRDSIISIKTNNAAAAHPFQSPFVARKDKLIDYNESYIIKHGLCVIPMTEVKNIRFHSVDTQMSFETGMTFDEILANSSYVKFEPLDLYFCYLSSDLDAKLFFNILNSSFWLKKTSDVELFSISNILEFTTSHLNLNDDYFSKIAKTFINSTENIFNLINNISDASQISNDLRDFLIPPEIEDENLLSQISVLNENMTENEVHGDGYEFLDLFFEDGRLKSLDELRNKVFQFGVPDKYRLIAYKYILGYYKPEMTLEDRRNFDLEKREKYNEIKTEAEAALSSPDYPKLSLFNEIIARDIPRCDRHIPFYKGNKNPNLESLENILKTYAYYDYKTGYDQSMTDLLSPLFYFIRDEADSFWVFVHMIQFRKKFDHNSELEIYETMSSLVIYTKFFFPNFFLYVANDIFYLGAFFGRLKLDFKRDFTLVEILRVWEVIWTQSLVKDYSIFLCLCHINKLCIDNNYQSYDFIELTKAFTNYTYGKSTEIIEETNQIIQCVINEPDIPKFIKDTIKI